MINILSNSNCIYYYQKHPIKTPKVSARYFMKLPINVLKFKLLEGLKISIILKLYVMHKKP